VELTWDAAGNFNGKAATGYRLSRGLASGAENAYFIVAPSATPVTFSDDGTTAPTPGSPQPSASVAWPLAGGDDGTVLVPATGDFDNVLLNDPSGHGLALLDRVPIFNLLCVPGETDAATVQKLQKYCADHRAFCIVDSEQTATVDTLRTNGPAGLTNAPNA